MFRTILLAAVSALALAKPQPNLFEDVITEELIKLWTPYDPHTFPTISNLKVDHDDTHLVFNFEEATFSGMSNVVCTHFAPPILTKAVTISLNHLKVDLHSTAYTVEGTLNGEPLSAAGAAELTANNLGGTVKFHADSYTLSPASLCIAPGTLTIDLVVESLVANFENAEALNQEIDARGPELVDILEADVMFYADDIVTALNNALCKK
ncbi:uncharacterized protein [Palaemon carinicauda]|uniref:uncharacterized protein n=1 Tax=Palaemon carinicauda TaxID=392227 RepID=UPI0035B64998